ncbi:MAG TPA: competence protein CoiA family protein [Chlamydiales bacterium]|nr:competence protein CoiA family protein [Chlamydiales bacterium]
MQIYALGDKGNLAIHEAVKGEDYLCPGCGEVVRARKGKIKQPHFYHIKKNRVCREANKSLAHLQMQEYLLKTLPKNEAEMEHTFPQIQRIADVFWKEQKIVFEIQCSPISIEEAQKRNLDYGSLGLTVIWLLHDRIFNKKKCKESELFLRKEGAYYFSLWKEVRIYDQWERLKGAFRVFRGMPLQVAIHLLKRRSNEIYFTGDVKDHLSGTNKKVLQQEKKKLKTSLKFLWKPLIGLWELLLQKSL